QAALANYRAGDRYAAARDWDAARAAFLAAGDYAHAGTRAADAAKKIGDRDATYAAAVAERDAGTWAAGPRDFRHVQEIASGFRDSAVLEQQVEQRVYLLALSGTVALRAASAPAANSVGLYLYMANGWNYLPGSDAFSRVRSNSAAPCLVYDTPGAPGPGIVPTPPSTVRPGGPWGDVGGPSGRRRLVVGDYSNILGYNPETRLYISDPNGDLALVAARQAIVQAAWLSPDGRFVLADEFIPRGTGPIDHRLVLLTSDQSHAPEVLM